MALPNGMSSCSMCVELMDGTAWTDYSDYLSVLDPPSMSRMSAEAYVFGEDTAVLGFGKLEPVEVTVRGVWGEGTTDPFYVAFSNHTTACGSMLAVRWSPGGCTTDNDSFRTSTTASRITNLVLPGGDAGSADIITWEATIRTNTITRAVWS